MLCLAASFLGTWKDNTSRKRPGICYFTTSFGILREDTDQSMLQKEKMNTNTRHFQRRIFLEVCLDISLLVHNLGRLYKKDIIILRVANVSRSVNRRATVDSIKMGWRWTNLTIFFNMS